jgi:hypothetical protein
MIFEKYMSDPKNFKSNFQASFKRVVVNGGWSAIVPQPQFTTAVATVTPT